MARKGFVMTDTTISDIQADAESVKDLFEFTPPRGVTGCVLLKHNIVFLLFSLSHISHYKYTS